MEDFELLTLLTEKNSGDIEAIANKIGGVPVLLSLTPHFVAILKTIQEAQQKTKAN